MTDEEFAHVIDNLAPCEFGSIDWQTLTPQQQTTAAMFAISGAPGDYEGLAQMLQVLPISAYIRAFEDLGFAETVAILRNCLTVGPEALLESEELFELAVDLEYNEREMMTALENYAKTHALFPRGA